jgi:type VI secretion system protein ImpJ
MYLGPHHFQVQNRYFEDSLHFASETLWYEGYGFAGYQLDAEALRNGTVSVLHARGAFRDGLLFDMPECDAVPAARNVGDFFPPTRDHLLAYLGIAKRKAEGQNCAFEAERDGNTRFSALTETVCDENTGHSEKAVQLGRKNLRLLFETEAMDEMEVLPVARIKRDTSGHFIYDASFIPPCLRLTASDSLMAMLRRLIEVLEDKSATLTRVRPGTGKFQAGMSARDVASFWFLHAINSGLAPLRHLYFGKRGHPEELFREMSRLAGAICTFGLDSHPRILPAYDHLNLDRCFQALDEHIRRHLEIMIPAQAISIPLRLIAPYFYQGEVTDARAFGPSRWLLAIHAKLGEAELIRKTPAVVKLCSAKFVPELVKRALPGITLTHLPVPPVAVAAKPEYQYFSISKAGPCWEHIVQTRAVGIYVPVDITDPELELLAVTD